MTETGVLPLFPLNVVLFPNQPLPLHIFEPRYKVLVQDCLSADRDFGVLLVHQGQLFQNGTCARIENILERFDDGRLKILTLGKKRFRVKRILEGKPYLEGEVEFWDDEKPLCPAAEALFQQVHDLLKEYAKLTGKISDHRLVENFTPYGFSFFLAEINMYSLTRQQEVLEMTSAEERLACGLKSLGHLVQRLKLDQRLQKILGNRNSFFNICN
ncbi:MAG TPA: LON peptidase substrate-binding domain-containing protein [Spirochaetia bacterium]|nr:LON peptidase substrate-binding domain-containing protein [Spirochaetia bacterium]